MAISCFYESHGVKLVVRSQQRSYYPRHVCLQGRTESCSAKVNECYLVRHLVRYPKGTLYPRRQDGIRQQDRSDATHRDSRKQLATHRKMRKHETAVCGTARTVVWEVGKCENRRQMPLYDQHLPPTRLTIQGERLLWGHFLFSNIRLIPLDSSQSLLAMLSL